MIISKNRSVLSQQTPICFSTIRQTRSAPVSNQNSRDDRNYSPSSSSVGPHAARGDSIEEDDEDVDEEEEDEHSAQQRKNRFEIETENRIKEKEKLRHIG